MAARRFFIALGIFMIGIPFGFLVSSLFAYSTPFAKVTQQNITSDSSAK